MSTVYFYILSLANLYLINCGTIIWDDDANDMTGWSLNDKQVTDTNGQKYHGEFETTITISHPFKCEQPTPAPVPVGSWGPRPIIPEIKVTFNVYFCDNLLSDSSADYIKVYTASYSPDGHTQLFKWYNGHTRPAVDIGNLTQTLPDTGDTITIECNDDNDDYVVEDIEAVLQTDGEDDTIAFEIDISYGTPQVLVSDVQLQCLDDGELVQVAAQEFIGIHDGIDGGNGDGFEHFLDGYNLPKSVFGYEYTEMDFRLFLLGLSVIGLIINVLICRYCICDRGCCNCCWRKKRSSKRKYSVREDKMKDVDVWVENKENNAV